MKIISKLKSLFINKKSFILLIADEGAILTHINGKTLTNRLYTKLEDEAGLNKFRNLLQSDPKVSISILLDVVDQSYNQQSLPAVSAFSIDKLVKKKLLRDFNRNELKGSIYIDRVKNGRADWNFLFISTPLVSPLTDWLNFIANLSNPFKAIYLLPIEAEKFIYNLSRSLNEDLVKNKFKLLRSETEHINCWQLFVVHNKVSGFRQVTYLNRKIVFTRHLNISLSESNNFIAGNIEQEVSNSVEYLKRLSLKEKDQLDLYIIVSSEIKNSLLKLKLAFTNLVIMTPFEAANQLNYQGAVAEDDKFGDVLISIDFANGKPTLPLIPDFNKKLIILEKFNKIAPWPLVIYSVVCLSNLGINYHQIYKNKAEIDKLEQLKNIASTRLIEVKKSAGNLKDAEKISNVVSLYKLIANNSSSPLLMIKNFINSKDENILVKTLVWKANLKSEGVTINQGINSFEQSQAAKNSSSNDDFTATFNLEIYNNDYDYQAFFNNFDDFIKNLKKIFINNNISYSRLTERINFNETNKVIPVQLIISNKNLKKAN